MDQSLVEMHRLLAEIEEHLKSGAKPHKSAAVAKLERLAAVATTLALTIQAARR